MISNFFQKIWQYFCRLDKLLLFCVFFLLVWSVVFIYGIGLHVEAEIQDYWQRQIVWIIVGLGFMFFFAFVDYRKLGKFSILFFLFIILLLISVLIFGVELNGSKSWLKFPGGTIQPSEIAKPLALFISAYFLSVSYNEDSLISKYLSATVAIFIPFSLIIAQPDHGSAMVLIPIYFVLVFLAGLKLRVMFFVAITALILAVPTYKYVLKDYQKQRIEVFLGLKDDSKSSSWNAQQSLYSVGKGGAFGKGIGNGTMYVLGYLPQTVAPTDFIFSVIGEETGFFGSFILIFIYLLIIIRAVHILVKTDDNFGKFLAGGSIAFIVTHCFINIGMTIGIAPIVGVPLPFMSYGGSFMIGCMIFMGFLQSIYVHSDDKK